MPDEGTITERVDIRRSSLDGIFDEKKAIYCDRSADWDDQKKNHI